MNSPATSESSNITAIGNNANNKREVDRSIQYTCATSIVVSKDGNLLLLSDAANELSSNGNGFRHSYSKIEWT